VAAQRGAVLNGEARRIDLALHNGGAAQLHQPGGADLTVDPAQHDDVLGDHSSAYVAFGAHRKARALQSDDAVYLAVNCQVLRTGELSADLRQRADHGLAFGGGHSKFWRLLGSRSVVIVPTAASLTIPNYEEGKQSDQTSVTSSNL